MRRVKVILVVTLLVVMPILGLQVVGVQAQDTSSDAKVKWPDLGGREITVAVENAYPPYNFLDSSNQGVGWDYDTFRDICQLLNCTAVFQQTAWDGMLVAISNGEFDVAADGITYTPDRDQTVDFSQLYQSYDETLLVRAGETRFSTVAELKALSDFRVATQVGTTNEITAHNLFGQDHTQSYGEFGAAIQALLDNDVDAVVVDRPAAEGYIQSQGGMKTLAESLAGVEGLAFAFPSGSSLVNPVNAAMSALMASGRWSDVYQKWFNTPAATPAQSSMLTFPGPHA